MLPPSAKNEMCISQCWPDAQKWSGNESCSDSTRWTYVSNQPVMYPSCVPLKIFTIRSQVAVPVWYSWFFITVITEVHQQRRIFFQKNPFFEKERKGGAIGDFYAMFQCWEINTYCLANTSVPQRLKNPWNLSEFNSTTTNAFENQKNGRKHGNPPAHA
jgi:hypothetical protein